MPTYELYDLLKDPGEMTHLIHSRQQQPAGLPCIGCFDKDGFQQLNKLGSSQFTAFLLSDPSQPAKVLPPPNEYLCGYGEGGLEAHLTPNGTTNEMNIAILILPTAGNKRTPVRTLYTETIVMSSN